MPPRVVKPFQINAVWNFGDQSKRNNLGLGYIPLTRSPCRSSRSPATRSRTPGDPRVAQLSGSGEGSSGTLFTGQLVGANHQVQVGVVAGAGGIKWNKRVDYVLRR